MKRFHWLLLGFAASVCIAAVAPTGGGGSSGVPTLNGTATNLQVYSSGTTNRPLRVFATNGTTEAYFDKDGRMSLGEFGTSGWWLTVYGDVLVYRNSQTALSSAFGHFHGGYSGFQLGQPLPFGWHDGSGATVSMDTTLRRSSAGVVEVSGASAGQYRDLVTRSTFATNASITNITADSYVTTQQTLSYASATNLTVDANKSLHFVSLTNTAYFAQPSNLGVGRTFTVILQQDGTGTRAVTFNTNYWKFPGGVVPTITTNANAYDVLSCISCPYGTNVFAIHNAKFQ